VKLTVLSGEFSVWRLDADAPQPSIESGTFLSITRTEDELSVVTSSSKMPDGASAETGWRCLKVEGPLAFDMTGVLAALSAPLAEAGIPIFAVSTYDTDYLLVKATDLPRTLEVLKQAGHSINLPENLVVV
jgi:hypothetical protein